MREASILLANYIFLSINNFVGTMLFILFFVPVLFLVIYLKIFRKSFLIENFLFDRIAAVQEYTDFLFYSNKAYFVETRDERGINAWENVYILYIKLTASLNIFLISLKCAMAAFFVFNPLLLFFVRSMNTKLLRWLGLGYLRFSASIHACSWIQTKLTGPVGEINWMSRKSSMYIDRDYIFSKKYKKTNSKRKTVTKKLTNWPYRFFLYQLRSVLLTILLVLRPAEYDEKGYLIYRIYYTNITSSLFMGADVTYFYFFFTNQKTGIVHLYHIGPINTIKKLIRIGFKSRVNPWELTDIESLQLEWYRIQNLYLLWRSFYSFIKKSLLAIIISSSFLFFSFSLFQVSLLKLLANWTIILLFAYWLISGFNFFLKRYRYGKYTSALQRFWKRAFMCFWMIEGFLFILFFYYFLNSSAEPVFMYDQNSLYLNQLSDWNIFLSSAVLLVFVINLILILTLTAKNRSNKTSIVLLSFITLFFLTLLLSESYQFYYVVNFYDDSTWVFSEEDNLWELEHDTPRTRTKNHYVTLCILAKFWHFIFIAIVWIFCVMKFFELGKLNYNLISLNYQNVIILYVMNWLFMISWAKWFLHRFFEIPYFWFFASNRSFVIRLLVNDIFALIVNIYPVISNYISFFKKSYQTSFHYFITTSNFSFDRTATLNMRFIQSLIN